MRGDVGDNEDYRWTRGRVRVSVHQQPDGRHRGPLDNNGAFGTATTPFCAVVPVTVPDNRDSDCEHFVARARLDVTFGTC